MEVTRKLITIVGCGPGARECVTPEALAAVRGAEVLIGAPRLLGLFVEATAERIPARGNIPEVATAIATNAGRRIAVLVTGDPGISSLARSILERFGLPACHLIPGVSSVQVAFARLGVDWMDARILSAHGGLPRTDFAALEATSKIAILAGSAGAAEWVAGLAEHLGENWQLFLAENLTLPSETIRAISPRKLRKVPCAALSILILLRSDC